MRGLAAGGGGCFCSAVGAPASTGSSARGLAIVIGLLALGLVRRRRTLRTIAPKARARAAQLGGVALATVVALGTQGCGVDPFCFSNCDEERLDAAMMTTDAGRPDTGGGGTVDGCIVSGDELCDAIDRGQPRARADGHA